MWLRDYYLSKIEKQLLKTDKALGLVKYEVSEDEQIRLEIQFKEEAHGVSPIRVQNNVLFDPDQDESLRAPSKPQANNVKSSSPFSKVLLDRNDKQMLRINNQGSGSASAEQ